MKPTALPRRNLLAAAALAALPLPAQDKPAPPPPKPRQADELVKAFVIAGHSDANIAKVKEMLDQDPRLAAASWDWGLGDWETALGGAGHIGSREMAHFLLENGARIDAFCAAMLGRTDLLAAVLATTPAAARVLGPHRFTLMYHAAISGQVPVVELIKPHLTAAQAPHFDQALVAAVIHGHLEMTAWLLKNGVSNPNMTDFKGRTTRTIATEAGHKEIAELLEKAGAR
jgi:Ankyrin repeats (3 copies)